MAFAATPSIVFEYQIGTVPVNSFFLATSIKSQIGTDYAPFQLKQAQDLTNNAGISLLTVELAQLPH
jgi:hypothetical protein